MSWEEIIIPLIIPLAVIMLIIYLKTQKIFTLAFSLSAAAYITTVIFTINEFELKANAVFLILIFSAVLMVFVGWYIANLKKKNGKKKR